MTGRGGEAALTALQPVARALAVPRTGRWLALVAGDWLIIVVTIVLCEAFWSWGGYVLAVLIIGARQHALGILMHDAVHYGAAPDRRLNDLLGNLLTAYPLLISLERFRQYHLAHHARTNAEDDPELISLNDPFRRTPFHPLLYWLYLALELAGVMFFRVVAMAVYFSFVRPPQPAPRRHVLSERLAGPALRAVFTLAVLAVLWATGTLAEAALYWLVPMATVLNALLRLRALAEHSGLDSRQAMDGTRNVMVGPLEAFLISPHRINLHLAHHLFPAVPSYNMAALHAALHEAVPDYAHQKERRDGYILGAGSMRAALCRSN